MCSIHRCLHTHINYFDLPRSCHSDGNTRKSNLKCTADMLILMETDRKREKSKYHRVLSVMSASLQHQITSDGQVTIFFKHCWVKSLNCSWHCVPVIALLSNSYTRHCKIICNLSLPLEKNMQDVYNTII